MPKMIMVQLDMEDMLLALESVIQMLYDAKANPELMKLLPPEREQLLVTMLDATARNKMQGEADEAADAAGEAAADAIAKAQAK